ncbi:MAG: hypothetical protein QOI04_532 [Verrucomicrobiota bacterium]
MTLPAGPISGGGGGNHTDAIIEWANVGTDWATGSNWVGGTAPADSTSTDIASFGIQNGSPVNPVLGAARSVNGVSFLSGAFSYTISGSTLTIGNGGISDSAANTETFSNTLRISASQTWTNNGGLLDFTGTVDLNATAATGRTLTVTGSGNTTFDGVIQNSFASSTGNLTYTGTGILTLNGLNTYTGTTTLSSGTVAIGNNSAFGTSGVTLGNTTLQAVGASRSLANNVTYTASTGATVSGSQNLTFTGTWTDTASRTLTNNMTSGVTLTLAGNVFLSDNNTTTTRRLTINGSGNTVISGVIANNNFGNTVAAGLTYSGSGSLTLSNTNTYSGGTIVSGGTLVATATGALGTGNVSLTASPVTLTLQGASTNYIGDTANLSILAGQTINLNFSGTDTIGALIVDGVSQPLGTYGAGATNPDGDFNGSGFLLVTAVVAVPERSTWTMLVMGAALLLGVQRWRRRRTS